MSRKILSFFPWPMIGSAVSSGLFGTKVAVGAKDTGFVCAKNGARPVAVGPAHNSGLVWKYCGTSGVGVEQSHGFL